MFFKRDLVLGQEYLAFLLLNLFDLFLTGWIFKNHGMEGNSLPAYVLQNYGLRDFALFKFMMVVFIIVLCEAIAIASIRKARFVIMAGCIVYLFVVVYESYLIITNIWLPDPSDQAPHRRGHPIIHPNQALLLDGGKALAVLGSPAGALLPSVQPPHAD